MKYPVVLIDLDDTLLDFGAASRASLTSLMARYGVAVTPEDIDAFEAINNQCWAMLERGEITREALSRRRFAIFLPMMGVTEDPMAANDIFRSGLADTAVLMPGALELCRALSQMTELYLVTNGFVETQKKRLAASGLEGLFRDVFTSQALGCSKPDREFFRLAFEKIGPEKREKAIILGDSLTSDMAGGKGFGIATCWYNPHGASPTPDCDYVISSLDQFIKIIM